MLGSQANTGSVMMVLWPTDAWVDNARYYVDKNGVWVKGAQR